MRSKFLACTALALVASLGGMTNVARAADPKTKGAQKKKPTELGGAIDKQLQWEDKVMGADDKRAELDKIARAQAINKAAAEKAEKEKAERERQAAREAAQPRQNAKKNEVAVPSVPEESEAKAKKVETVEATPPPPPPAKPADDKFIDKLLREESSSKKKVSKGDDKDLDALLAGTTPKSGAKGHGKRGDAVDSLLDSADKAPAMPAPRARPVVPEWAKPELPSTPAPTPIAVRPQPRKDDGVIHVVQGAAMPAATRPAAAPAAPVAARVAAPPPAAAGRRQAAARSASWNDPFAPEQGSSSSKRMAARDRDGFDDAPPPVATTRRAPPPPPAPARSGRSSGGSWNDPFADAPDSKPVRRTPPAAATTAPKPAPAKPTPRPRWKDPFSAIDSGAAARPARA